MAKSIPLTDFTESSLTAPQHSGAFWEHWFDTQHTMHTTEQKLDEHRIWEKAVHLGVPGNEKGKH